MNTTQDRSLWERARGFLLGFVILAALVVLAVAGWSFMGDFGASDKAFVFYTVARGDLPIVVTERGSLEAQVETTIRNKVETISIDRSRTAGTQIIFIVPNGSFVNGPPPPAFLVKLDGDLLRVFSISGEADAASEVERFQVRIADGDEMVEEAELLQFGTELVEAFNTGRVLPELHDQFAQFVTEVPERFVVQSVEAGKQWTVSYPGDFLIELDSATIRDKMETQEVTVQKAISARIQAESKYQNQKLQNETALAEAKLRVDLTKLEVEKFLDPVKGDHQLELEDIERQIDDQNNTILESRTNLKLKANDQRGIEALFKLGYRGKGDFDRARLDFLNAEGKLAAAANRLRTYQANRSRLVEYDRTMKELTLLGAVETSIRSLQQVKNDNAAILQQALASKDEAITTAEKEQERLTRLATQLEYCNIYAPHDGMVVYAREGRRNETEIAEGVAVRERQRLVTLPDLSRMQVKTQVHEAVLDQVRPGLPVTVRLDAYPDAIYSATVYDVAVVPQSGRWGSAGVKVYETIVRIDEEVENLKPGMTAVCEIHVDRIKDILSVPVQAIVQIERDNWCYVDSVSGIERRMLELGRSNDKFVHIRKGLAEGGRVVLNPMAILEDTEETGNDISPEKGAPEMPEISAQSGEASNDSGQTTPAATKGAKQDQGQNKRRAMSEQFKNMDPQERKKMLESMRKKSPSGGN